MITISLGQLRAPAFAAAFQKIMKTSGLDAKVSYHCARMSKILDSELTTANVTFDKMVKEHAEFKNEKGESFWKIPEEKIPTWNKMIEDFHAETVKIDKHKIKLSDIEKAQLTPADFLALEPVLAGFEILEGGTNGQQEKS